MRGPVSNMSMTVLSSQGVSRILPAKSENLVIKENQTYLDTLQHYDNCCYS